MHHAENGTTGGIYGLRQLQLRLAVGSSPVGSPRRLAVAKSIFGENNAYFLYVILVFSLHVLKIVIARI